MKPGGGEVIEFTGIANMASRLINTMNNSERRMVITVRALAQSPKVLPTDKPPVPGHQHAVQGAGSGVQPLLRQGADRHYNASRLADGRQNCDRIVLIYDYSVYTEEMPENA